MRIALTLLVLGLPLFLAEAAGPKSDLRGDVRVEYTDNHFRLSDQQIDEFDLFQGDDERFFDMDDPEDLVTRARLRGYLRWKLAKKRQLELMLGGAYAFHARNGISDYPTVMARASVDVTKKDSVHARLESVFDRFWKNYRIPNDTDFAPAVYDQIDLSFGYTREVGKRSQLGIEVRRRERDYEAPLASRDRTGSYVRGSGSYRLAKKVRGSTGVEIGSLDIDPISDGGLIVDRSYDQQQIDQELNFKLSSKINVAVQAQYRVREFQTSNAADLARFDREDSRLRLRLTASRELKKNLFLEGRISVTDNDSDRLDPMIDTDDVGYEENALGFGIRYKFF